MSRLPTSCIYRRDLGAGFLPPRVKPVVQFSLTGLFMPSPAHSSSVIRFGAFELNAASGELRKAGRPQKIHPQPFRVLLLAQRPGEIVTREEIQRCLWGANTFVDFEGGINFCMRQIRTALADDAESPRYIETVPRRGYRFIASSTLIHPTKHITPLTQAAAQTPVSSDQPKTASRGPAEFPSGPHIHVVPSPLPHTVAPRSITKNAVLVIATLSGVAILIAGTILYFHRTPRLTDKDTIVLADYTNTTGDPVFDGTLRQGLAVQLEQSPFLSLVSEEHIRQVLRLMGQPANATLTPEVAQEICERTGSAAVLEGSIASLGSRYVLGLRAKNCRTGDVLDEEQVQAARKEDVLNALGQIASKFRTRVGESLIAVKQHNTPLAEATTPSLEALKAYGAARKVHSSSGAMAALPLFRRATEIDPKFAMAHAFLGRMYADIEEPALSAQSTSRAYQLRDRASDPEKFFITAGYETLVTGNLEKARETCEAWAQTYPHEVLPHAGLSGYINKAAGQYEKAIAEARKAIELDSDFGIGYYNLAVNHVYLDRLGEAEDALRRAAGRGLEIDEFVMLEYDVAFLRGDQAGMEREAARARRRAGAESWISNREAFTLAYSGHLQQARSMSRRAVDADLAQRAAQRERAGLWEAGAAVREAFFGNASEARKRAMATRDLSKDRAAEYGAALALALSGDSSWSQTLANDVERRFPEDTSVRLSYLPTLRALAALNQGEPAKAIELLQIAVPHELGAPASSVDGFFGALYPIYVRGEAYLVADQGTEAATEFQKILDHRGIVVSDPIGALAHLQLGRAFAVEAGLSRHGENRGVKPPLQPDALAKAKAAYQDFLTLWKDADPDIPILKQAKAEYAKLQ